MLVMVISKSNDSGVQYGGNNDDDDGNDDDDDSTLPSTSMVV